MSSGKVGIRAGSVRKLRALLYYSKKIIIKSIV